MRTSSPADRQDRFPRRARRRVTAAAAALAAVLALAGTATSPPRARSAPLERIEGGASTSIQVANLDREQSAAALITLSLIHI